MAIYFLMNLLDLLGLILLLLLYHHKDLIKLVYYDCLVYDKSLSYFIHIFIIIEYL